MGGQTSYMLAQTNSTTDVFIWSSMIIPYIITLLFITSYRSYTAVCSHWCIRHMLIMYVHVYMGTAGRGSYHVCLLQFACHEGICCYHREHHHTSSVTAVTTVTAKSAQSAMFAQSAQCATPGFLAPPPTPCIDHVQRRHSWRH